MSSTFNDGAVDPFWIDSGDSSARARTTFARLIDYPHAAVFDKSAKPEVAFLLSHPEGARWEIYNGVLHTKAGEKTYEYRLTENLRIGDIVNQLISDEFIVRVAASEITALAASALVSGKGSDASSAASAVHAYTSIMWVLMDGYAGEMQYAEAQIGQAIRQMVVTQAEGEWLDLWGKLYATGRRQGESDANYAPRIPKEAFRIRESPIAIEQAVKDATGKTIRIEEPWGSIFRLDFSTLSGPDKFQDWNRVGYFYIQPTSTVPLDWSDILPVIDRNRAAGIVTLPPFSRNHTSLNAGVSGAIDAAVISIHSQFLQYVDRTLLDFSLIEDVALLNNPARHRQTVRRTSSSTAASGWSDATWHNQLWSDTTYTIDSYYFRSYRLYQFVITYEDQFWAELPWKDAPWSEFNTLFSSRHSRS